MKWGWWLMLLVCNVTIAQNTYWSKAQLRQDADSLIFNIEHAHPDLFIYITESDWRLAKTHFVNQLSDSMTTAQFGKAIGELFKSMKDSHSQISYGFLWDDHLKNGGRVLPISKRGHLVTKGSLAHLLPGDSLIKIQGFSIDSIDHLAGSFSLLEGQAWKSEKRMRDVLFSLTCALFVIKNNANIEITASRWTENGDSTFTITCATFNEQQWKKEVKKQGNQNFGDVAFENKSNDVGYLKVSTFAPHKFIRYQRKIKRAFKNLMRNDIDTLIIDLRGNAGGLSTEVEYLYSFIDKKGYNTPSNIVGKRSKISDQKYRFLNRKWVQWWVDHFLKNQEDIFNYVQLRKQPIFSIDTVYFHKPLIQKKWVFEKTVILWADALTASAGVDFTHHFHETQRGEHWGEPVMGPMTGTYGNTFPYSLPISKIKVNISTIRYNYNNQFIYSDIPIEPNLKIQWTRQNIIHREDAYWEQFKKMK